MTDTMTDPDFTLPDPDSQPGFYANVPLKRLLAWIVDLGLVFVLCLLVLPFTAFTGIFFFGFLLMVTGFIYRWATISGGSATWGMRLMGVELRNSAGHRFDAGEAFLHTMGYAVSVGVFPLQAISVLLMVLTDRGQGLTDHVMGSVAVNRRAPR